MTSLQHKEWVTAMLREIETIKERKVWKLVDRPKDEKVIPNRWVFTLKNNMVTGRKEYKARLVAGGHRQRKYLDYDEVFSPVVNFTIIRFTRAV